MNKCTLLLAGLLASPAIALEVTILDAAYMTDLFVQQRDPLIEQALPTTSSAPISNALFLPGQTYFSRAQASADTFGISTDTAAFDGGAVAAAQTILTFTPLVDGTAPLAFTAVAGNIFFTDASFSLFDVTANRSLFNYSWEVPAALGDTQNVVADLLSSHTYTLSLRSRSGASNDQWGARLNVAGLTPAVPEPETLAMMLLGLSLVGLARRFIPKAGDDDDRPVELK